MSTDAKPAGFWRYAYWAGWVLSALLAALLVFSASVKFAAPAEVVEDFKKHGFADNALFWIGIAEVASVALYLIPKTSVLGAILLTGYLGGATATHVARQEAFVVPVLVGVLVWVALYLRDAKIRELAPWRRG